MIQHKQIWMRLILATAFIIFSNNCFAFRCGTHLISEGDLALQVKEYCGAPSWVDRWYETLVLGENTEFEYSRDSVIERWVYNLGPQKLMRYVLIRNNRVYRVETGDHGFVVPTNTRCDASSFTLGMSEIEAKAQCGEPDSTSRRYISVAHPLATGAKKQLTYPVDEWVYNLGPNNFLRILTFSQGVLVNIQTGARGFN